MAEFAFDIYPSNDPAGKASTTGTAARLARLTIADQLTDGWYKHHGFGLSEGAISIHADHADAVHLHKRAYVMFVRTDTGPEQQIGGFFLEEGDFVALSTEEEGGRVLTFGGPGGLFMLDRYRLGHSVYATGQPERGDFDIPDQWTWSQEPYGAMLVRGIEEGQDHPDAFFAALTFDFTRTEDSNSNNWSDLEDYNVPIGTSILELYADFLSLGLIVQCSADLNVSAYRDIDEYRTDRTSATFAAGKARFAAGVNIANALTRRIAAKQERTHVLYRDRTGDYQTITTGGSGEPYMDFRTSDTTADDAAIIRMGTEFLTRKALYVDQATVTHIIGDGVGQYAPGPAGDYWVLDLSTIHTGTDEHDFNNQSIEVASILFHFDEAGNPLVSTQLGAQHLDAQREAFQALASSIRNTPTLHLCHDTPGGAFSAPLELLMKFRFRMAVTTQAHRLQMILTDTAGAATLDFEVNNANGVGWSDQMGIGRLELNDTANSNTDGPATAGIITTVDDVWCWLRVRADTDGQAKARLWKDGTSEPGTWSVETDDAPVVWDSATAADLDTLTFNPTLGNAASGSSLEIESIQFTDGFDGLSDTESFTRTEAAGLGISEWNGQAYGGRTTLLAVNGTQLVDTDDGSSAEYTLTFPATASNTCIHGGPAANSGADEECNRCAAPGNHEHDYVAAGGATGLSLLKASGADWDTLWGTPAMDPFIARDAFSRKLKTGVGYLYSAGEDAFIRLEDAGIEMQLVTEGFYVALNPGFFEVLFADVDMLAQAGEWYVYVGSVGIDIFDDKVRLDGGNGVVFPILAADPVGGDSEDGQAYYDSVTDTFRGRKRGVWEDIGTPSYVSIAKWGD